MRPNLGLLCCLALWAGSASTPVAAQTPVRLELNSGSGPLVDSSPRDLFRAPDGRVYFSACTPEHGCELWRSDGSEAGTQLVRDIRPGVASSQPFAFGSDGSGQFVYFSADDGSHGRELWRSDGSAAGTVLVADLLPGLDGSYPGAIHPVAGGVAFAAATPALGKELYRADTSGAQLVVDLAPGSASGVSNNSGGVADLVGVSGNRVVFAGFNNTSGTEPYVSDGTAAGTALIRELVAGSGDSAPFDFVSVGSGLAFVARTATDGFELYLSDFSSAGTQRVSQIAAGSAHGVQAILGVSGNLVFLAGSNGSNGVEPYAWNGSSIVALAEIGGGSASGLSTSEARRHSTVAAGFLYFPGRASASGEELWRSNGSAAGTAPVVDFAPGPGDAAPRHLVAVNNGSFNGVQYVIAGTGSIGTLARSDGTAAGTFTLGVGASTDPGTRPVTIGSSGAQTLLIAAADTTRPDTELWKSAASVVSTTRVKDIASHQGSALPSRPIVAGNNAYFAAFQPASGFELYVTRGVPANTALVTDLRPGTASGLSSSDSSNEGVLQGIGLGTLLIYMADAPTTGPELHVSDGTAAGTRLLLDLNAGSGGSFAHAFAETSGRAFALIDTLIGGTPQTVLVASNGTPAGTTALSLTCTPQGSGGLLAIGALVYFQCQDAAFGLELYRIDAASLALTRVTDLGSGPDSASIRLLGRIGIPARLLFLDETVDRRLLVSDGTPAGTVVAHTAGANQDIDGDSYPDVAGNAWLRGRENGQAVVFRLAANAPHALTTVFGYGSGPAAPDGDLPSITSTGCSLLFKDALTGEGMELVRADTSAQTGGIVQPSLQPGLLSSTPGALVALPGADAAHLSSLIGSNGAGGVELTRIGFRAQFDGVTSFDIAAGPASSSPRHLTMLGKLLLFSAHTAADGRELYALPSPDQLFADDFSRGCGLPP